MIPFQLHRRIPLVRRPFYQRDRALEQRDRALEQRDRALEQRDRALEQRDQSIAERDCVIAERDHFAMERDRTEDRLSHLERELGSRRGLADRECHRLDWALGALEGIVAEIDAYHAARDTDEYRAAFEVVDPLVSVCVATMDRADLLLGRCIPSLLGQTHGNIEIIVVGDNCTDDTVERLAAVGDARIRFENLPQRGPYPRPGQDRWYVAGTYAMNRALSRCAGDFITHIDDDDSMVPHRIEMLVGAAKQSKADFLWHPLRFQNTDGTWTLVGNGRLEVNQVGTGSLFYHRYFARFPWDVMSYRLQEPGDWNRIRRIKMLRPRLLYVDEPLANHHAAGHPPFIAREGERFLE